MGLFGRISKIFKARPEQSASVLDLRGVVVASSIEDVYVVKRRLGEGQTAMVYEGVRRADGKSYALKAFKLDDGRDASCEGLRDEVEILRALPKHSGVCTLREIISTPGCVYLSMELVAGGDLLSPIEERGAYSESTACSLFAQMVDAVDFMHQAGVVHRDLKPENVCFTDKRRTRLRSSTWVRRASSRSRAWPISAARPVRRARGHAVVLRRRKGPPPPRYDERVDLWSMGIALYVMLSGSAPFDQEQPVDKLLKEVCRGRLGMATPDWRHISSEAKAVVKGLLAVKPADRMGMAQVRARPRLT